MGALGFMALMFFGFMLFGPWGLLIAMVLGIFSAIKSTK